MSISLQTNIKKSLALTILVGLLATSSFLLLEPTLSSAANPDSIVVTQTVTSDIALSAGGDISLTTLNTTQQSAVGNTSWTVTTNNASGYYLQVNATSSPAFLNVDTASTTDGFTDYTDTGGPEQWSVTNGYEFGFSAFGSDVAGAYGTDTDCVDTTDVPSATLNWEGFQGATQIQIASSTSATDSAGAQTTLCVADEWETTMPPSGNYEGTIVATAVAP